MLTLTEVQHPGEGRPIEFRDGRLMVPDRPIIPVIAGDGAGPAICRITCAVLDAAVRAGYGGERKICWTELCAGEAAKKTTGESLPAATLQGIEAYSVAVKGPLSAPEGDAFSLELELFRSLRLSARVRPFRYFEGIPSPMRDPGRLSCTIFGEIPDRIGDWRIRADAPAGFPGTAERRKNLVRHAIRYALENDCNLITLVHGGEADEVSCRMLGYEVAREEFGIQTVTEVQVYQNHRGTIPPGKWMVNDRPADFVFRQALMRPEELKIMVVPSPICDYLSSSCAAQVGMTGFAPAAAFGGRIGIFEAGDPAAALCPDPAAVNPGSGILSGVMMLEHLRWYEAADALTVAFAKTISQRRVTRDLASRMDGATQLETHEFGAAVIENMIARGSY
jgi:isocitrate dehydrogenase